LAFSASSLSPFASLLPYLHLSLLPAVQERSCENCSSTRYKSPLPKTQAYLSLLASVSPSLALIYLIPVVFFREGQTDKQDETKTYMAERIRPADRDLSDKLENDGESRMMEADSFASLTLCCLRSYWCDLSRLVPGACDHTGAIRMFSASCDQLLNSVLWLELIQRWTHSVLLINLNYSVFSSVVDLLCC